MSAQLADLRALGPDELERLAQVTLPADLDAAREQIVGVIPDAEGPGKPSIQLARRL